jgi:hypothetical protein
MRFLARYRILAFLGDGLSPSHAGSEGKGGKFVIAGGGGDVVIFAAFTTATSWPCGYLDPILR